MRRQWVVTGWAAAAVIAVAAGVGAVALAQGGTLGPPTEPVSEESVRAALEDATASPTASETPSPSASPSESPSAEEPSSPAPTGQLDEVPSGGAETGEEVFAVDGGTFLARCSGNSVELMWWVAAQGWQVSSVDPGPGEDAEIEFEGAGEAEYNVACVDGAPQSSIHTSGGDDDDGGDD